MNIKKLIAIILTCALAFVAVIGLALTGLSLWISPMFTAEIKIILALTIISLLIITGILFVNRVMHQIKQYLGQEEPPPLVALPEMTPETENFIYRAGKDSKAIAQKSGTPTDVPPTEPTPPTPPEPPTHVPVPKRKYKPVFGPGSDPKYKH